MKIPTDCAFKNAMSELCLLKEDHHLVLEREPNNPDDANAVRAPFEIASATHKDQKAAGSMSDGLFDNWLLR
ncbi:MAG TPA: hypothetical protein VJ464_11970 [Blastocatellia bacterium]|nr:hypothetical protein [Blastocatellia bacterium]